MPNKVPEFEIKPELQQMTAEDWQNLSEEQFKKLFKKSSVERKKYETFIENVAISHKTTTMILCSVVGYYCNHNFPSFPRTIKFTQEYILPG